MLGAGLTGTGTDTGGGPSDVSTTPLVMTVEAVLPDSDAAHMLLTESAVNGPDSTVVADAELVTDPVGPIVP